MKTQIIYSGIGRLRLRVGKYILNQKQGYSLETILFSISGVTNVTVTPCNGSILIQYDDTLIQEDVFLQMIQNLKREDLVEAEPTSYQQQRSLEQQYKQKMLHITLHQFVIRNTVLILLPPMLRNSMVWYKAIHFVKEGWYSLRKKHLTVEVLDATAITTSLIRSDYKTASSIMYLLQLSELLMAYSNVRAKNALVNSLEIKMNQVWLVKEKEEVLIPLKELQVGDVICIRAGSMIPVDGEVIQGEATLNESMMTGEPLPVYKSVGATVFAGTILEEGEIFLQVRELSGDSRIAKIIEMIDSGEEKKASIQSNAERLADGIVPISFGLFVVTLLATRNISRALSVLLVDFSCAIKITTPLVIMSGLREGAQNQVVIKGGKYLEQLSQVDTVVFDKTGTLTNAVPQISKIIVMDSSYKEEEILRISACLEEHFPHSVAAAIVAEAEARNVRHPEDHEKVEYIVAHGIASSFQGKRAVIGSYHFLFEDEGIEITQEQKEEVLEKIGNDSAVFLAINQQLVGVICVNDPPREDAKSTIEALRKQGIDKIIMITGDGEATAKHMSQQLGLDGYYAAVLPDGKAQLIAKLQEEGRKILMIGDGINDAPALSCADVSMTLRGSSDIAREVADITILSDELEKIVYARKLATALMGRISFNYRVIVGFNAGLIGCGIMGALSNNQSAWLHNVSTLLLAANSTNVSMKDTKMEEETDETT